MDGFFQLPPSSFHQHTLLLFLRPACYLPASRLLVTFLPPWLLLKHQRREQLTSLLSLLQASNAPKKLPSWSSCAVSAARSTFTKMVNNASHLPRILGAANTHTGPDCCDKKPGPKAKKCTRCSKINQRCRLITNLETIDAVNKAMHAWGAVEAAKDDASVSQAKRLAYASRLTLCQNAVKEQLRGDYKLRKAVIGDQAAPTLQAAAAQATSSGGVNPIEVQRVRSALENMSDMMAAVSILLLRDVCVPPADSLLVSERSKWRWRIHPRPRNSGFARCVVQEPRG
jgi:hypothetical protein